MRMSDWGSDLCASDLVADTARAALRSATGESRSRGVGPLSRSRCITNSPQAFAAAGLSACIAGMSLAPRGDRPRKVSTIAIVLAEIGRASGRGRVGQYG